MSHYISECECGRRMGGCRCLGSGREKRIVSPCTHGSETGELQTEEANEPQPIAAMRGIDG